MSLLPPPMHWLKRSVMAMDLFLRHYVDRSNSTEFFAASHANIYHQVSSHSISFLQLTSMNQDEIYASKYAVGTLNAKGLHYDAIEVHLALS